MSRHIIPVFIPHKGCPHDCVFCNQKRISGCISAPDEKNVRDIIEAHLKTNGERPVEIAFFGGSFTGIPLNEQEMYLQIVDSYRREIPLDIRASTRPDCIFPEVTDLLTKYKVGLIELGVQSMDDKVLRLSGRGHDSKCVGEAVKRLRSSGIEVGIQTMLGLPGDSFEGALSTANKVIELAPSVVRIYPTLVIRDTALADMYYSGTYTAMSLEEAVELTAILMEMYENAGINVIRAGLQPTENISDPGENRDVIAGPFHPAFRQLANSRRVYNKIVDFLSGQDCSAHYKSDKIEMYIDKEKGILNMISDFFSQSDIIGQNKANARAVYDDYGLRIKVINKT